MIIQLVLALFIGFCLLFLVLGPFLTSKDPGPSFDDLDVAPPEETRRGQALLAIRDLEFDHATGKISDEDFAELRPRFADEALAVLRTEAKLRATQAPGCPLCGPRPEPDARFCSNCGRPVVTSSGA